MTIARNDLPLDAVSINGSYIDDDVTGLMTLRSVGREITLRELSAVSRIADGSILVNSRYPERQIVVHFIIKRNSLANMRSSMESLKRMLDVSNATIIFNGDSSYYYIGTPTLDEDITEAWNGIVGSFTITCMDPFKYSVTEYTTTAAGGQFNVTYNGTYKSYPTLIAAFPDNRDAQGDDTTTSQCGYIGYVDQRDHVLQFGDPNDTDWADVTYPATVPVNKAFSSTTGWTLNGSKVHTGTQVGTIGVNSTNKYMYSSGFGSGTDWHGPSLSKIITGESAPIGTNFNFTWKQKFLGTKSQFGVTEVLLWNNDNGTRTLVSGARFVKTTKDTNCTVYMYVGSTANKGSFKVDCSKIGSSSMKKIGTKITFSIAGKTFNYSSANIDTLIANEITFHFLRKGTQTVLGSNYVYGCKLQRLSFDNYEDVANIFMPGDVLTVVTQDAGVYLDDGSATVSAAYLGALGNDWEDFCLVPGSNTIAVDYSDFTTEAPTFTMKYRERFL